MITLGLDPHPGSHTVVALDESGISLGHLTVTNTMDSTQDLSDLTVVTRSDYNCCRSTLDAGEIYRPKFT